MDETRVEELGEGEREGLSESREGLRRRFAELWEEHGGRVRAIVAAGRCEDPEALVGEVARKAWQGFPATVKRERKRMGEGWPGYNWAKWFGRAAERVVIDARRRARTARRVYGYRAEAGMAEKLRGLSGGELQGRDEWEPLDVDLVADEGRGNDPAVAAERSAAVEALRRALATLSDAEVACLMGWARGEQNWETAAGIGMSWTELVALRGSAIDKVRAAMARLGWTECPGE